MRLATITYTLLLATMASAVSAQATLRAAPSGRGITEVTLTAPRGSGDSATRVIRVDYGQPHLRGRALHTDSLVPYDRAWRTGANSATTLRTDVDLVIGGADVPKGTYFVFTMPSQAGWKLMLQKDNGQNGAMYEPQHDVARIDLRHRAVTPPLESLTMWLIPARVADGAGPQRGELRISWGTFEVATDWVVK